MRRSLGWLAAGLVAASLAGSLGLGPAAIAAPLVLAGGFAYRKRQRRRTLHEASSRFIADLRARGFSDQQVGAAWAESPFNLKSAAMMRPRGLEAEIVPDLDDPRGWREDWAAIERNKQTLAARDDQRRERGAR